MRPKQREGGCGNRDRVVQERQGEVLPYAAQRFAPNVKEPWERGQAATDQNDGRALAGDRHA
jgi:hypothetical protein